MTAKSAIDSNLYLAEARHLLTMQNAINDAIEKNRLTVFVQGADTEITMAKTMLQVWRNSLEYELAGVIYGQAEGPKDYGEVVAAAKKEINTLLKKAMNAYPELAGHSAGRAR